MNTKDDDSYIHGPGSFPQEVADCVECDLKIMIVSDTKAKVDAARTKIVDLVLDVPAIHDVMVTVTGAKQELR